MFFKKYPSLCKFKPYFDRYKRLTALLLGCMITASSMGIILTYLSSRQLIAISEVSADGMVRFTLLTLGAATIHHVMWFFWDKISAIIGSRIAADIRRDIVQKMINMKISAVREHASGYYLERLNDDAGEISFFLQNVLGTYVDLLTNVCFLMIIYLRSWQCGLLFTLGIAWLYLIDLWKIRVELRHTKAVKEMSEMLNSRMTEVVRGIREIKELGLKEEIHWRVDRISVELTEMQAKKKRDVTVIERIRTYSQ